MPTRRIGRPPLAPLLLARVAQDYARAIDAGAHPVAAVARLHGVSPSVARNRISAARIGKFLIGGGGEGRKGGRLSDKAKKLVREGD